MDLKEKLGKMKMRLLDSSSLGNRDYEFEAELENHPLGNQNIYRLHYINYHRIGERYGQRGNNVGVIDWSFKPFVLPNGMSREDSFKVLSYLTDFIEAQLNLEPCSHNSVSILDNVLNLERLGFKKLNISLDSASVDVIDLFTVSGRLQLFKSSNYYQRYFEWYTEGVTFDEVNNIYNKCGIEFYDLVDINDSFENLQLIKK